MKYADKTAFLESVNHSWNSLKQLCDSLPDDSWSQTIGRDDGSIIWRPKDVCGHLYSWHLLLLGWIKAGEEGRQPELPAAGYNWRQTPALNKELFDQLHPIPARNILRRLKLSHSRVIKIVLEYSNKQLMQSGHFEWTRKLGLISYVSANTDSHYRWALKKLKRVELNS